jgi:hypothetical protein
MTAGLTGPASRKAHQVALAAARNQIASVPARGHHLFCKFVSIE